MNCAFCNRDIERCTHAPLHEEIRVSRAMEAARQKIEPSRGVVMVRSLVSHRTEQPRVDIQVGEIHTQMDAAAAMDLAKNLIECATGAYADAFIFNFLTHKLEQPASVGGQIIEEFREYREQLQQEFKAFNEEEGV